MKLTPDQIKSIAQDLQAGMRCFIHRETGEVISVLSEEDMLNADLEYWEEELDKIEVEAPHLFQVEPMPSHDAFRMMEVFAETTPRTLKAHLLLAMEKRRPFAHFKQVVDNAGEWRLKWFAFRDQRYEEYVREQIEREFRERR
jgi:hypothetical protein